MENRKRNRLSVWDYDSAGGYFLTICTQDRKCVLARVVGGGIPDAPKVELTEFGKLTEEAILYLHDHLPGLRVDKYVVMPNHIHLILIIEGGSSGASRMPPPTKRANSMIPRFVSSLKRFTNKKAGTDLWQRSYHDHILRNQADYLRVWNYIDGNPARWEEDEYFLPVMI